MVTKLKNLTQDIKFWFAIAVFGADVWAALSIITPGSSTGYILGSFVSYAAVILMVLALVQLAVRLKSDSNDLMWFRMCEQLPMDGLSAFILMIATGLIVLFSWVIGIYDVWMWGFDGQYSLGGRLQLLIGGLIIFLMILPEAFVGVLCYIILVRRFKDTEKRGNWWIAEKLGIGRKKEKGPGLFRRLLQLVLWPFKWTAKMIASPFKWFYRICSNGYTSWKADYEKGHDFEQKQMIRSSVFIGVNVFIMLGLLLGFPVLWMICVLAFGIVLYMGQKDFYHYVGQILGELHSLSEGDVIHPVNVPETSPLFEGACDLNKVNESLDLSVKRQMKSEQMKVDLITNVSHDLKTPLTSIIGYIDLLKKEEMSQEAKDYVNVISMKSEHLKDMIQDLFEISKATSGNAELVLEKLDMVKLIEQTLGDMEDRIEKSGRTIRTNFSETPLYISGDGRRLYRVYQNLIENALKYSMEGTRIYVDAEQKEQRIVTTIKNIAAYEMNFTTDKIVERFQRGDDSRTTEGHGLGLAIAKSFSEACGGQLDIVIDGDMFKALITYPLYRED